MTRGAKNGTCDAFLGGKVRLRQPSRGNRASIDAILLAAAVPLEAGGLCADLGAGTGAAGLALAVRAPDSRIALVDKDKAALALADENIVLNGLEGRVFIARCDIGGDHACFEDAGLSPGSCAAVMANPPYYPPGTVRLPTDTGRRSAFVAEGIPLSQWLKVAARLLRAKGSAVFIHRPEALAELLEGCRNRFGGIEILPIQPRPQAPAIRIILRAVKSSRAPLRLLPPFILHEAQGSHYAASAGKVLSGDGILPLDEGEAGA